MADIFTMIIDGKSYLVTAVSDNAFKSDTKVKTVKLSKTIEKR